MYNFKEGKKRVEEIINTELEIKEENYLPKSIDLTFNNGYITRVASISIDIRESSPLFKNENKEKIAKLSKAFNSELIKILNTNDNVRESRVIGDCSCAIYTSPNTETVENLYNMASYCNMYVKMLNQILKDNNLPTFKAGIGLGYSEVLLVKSTMEDSVIEDKLWLGASIIDACKFSNISNKGDYKSVIMSKEFYNTVSSINKNVEKEFEKKDDPVYGECYTGELIIPKVNKWITNEFND